MSARESPPQSLTTFPKPSPSPMTGSWGEVGPDSRLSLHTPATIYQTQYRSMCTDLVQNGGDIDYNGLFHHVSAQGAVVLMLAKRVLELEKVESELKAVKEMYNLP